AVLPKLNRLMFEGDPRCVSNPKVRMAQVRPDCLNHALRRNAICGAMECLQFATKLPGGGRGSFIREFICGFAARRNVRAYVRNAVQAGLSGAPAGNEIHRAIGTESEVRYIERSATDQEF